MKIRNYIPRRDIDFLEWAKKLFSYAKENHTRWLVISPIEMLEEPLRDFEVKLHNSFSANRGKADTFIKNEARNVLEKACRIRTGFCGKKSEC